MEFTFDLNTIWFILIGVLLVGYAILDGFDLGVGAIHLMVKGDRNRRVMLNSIGPVWDGNEVWLVTGGGALFASFPDVYATVFSGFYTAFMLLLFVIIFRAVSIEFRSKMEQGWWRNMWDRAFSISSVLIALLMGISIGNLVAGIPIGPDKEFMGGFLTLLRPYPLLVGLTTVSLFVMHGTIYAYLKTEGDLQQTLKGWINNSIIAFVILYVITTQITIIFYPHMIENFKAAPVLFIVPLLNILAVANIPRQVYHGREFKAFLSSCASIAALLAIFAIGLFPNLIYSSPVVENSLNIYNASSSQKTLQVMLTVAIIGIPFVLAYTIAIYWVFRGKVKLEDTSY